jgi:hypothetical protein
MKIASFVLAAALSAGTLFSAVAPAAAIPVNRPEVSQKSDVVQVRGGDRDWGDRRDWQDRRDGRDRDWRDRRYWRPAWGYERRYWRPSREERWRDRHYRRHYDGPIWLFRS